jgi:hypothetical protein
MSATLDDGSAEPNGKWNPLQTPAVRQQSLESAISRPRDPEISRLSRSPGASFCGYLVDLPGFFTNWTNFLWIAFYVTILLLASRLQIPPFTTQHTAFIPQYAPWYSYQIGLTIPPATATTSRARLSITILSKSSSPVFISGNITAATRFSQFQMSATNEPFPVFESPSRRDGSLDLKIEFNPGLSPSDNLLFTVSTDSSLISVIHCWIYAGFSLAIAVQFVVFCVHFGHIDPVQIATAFFAVLRLFQNLSFVYPDRFFSFRPLLRWFELCYCAFIFAALVPNQ